MSTELDTLLDTFGIWEDQRREARRIFRKLRRTKKRRACLGCGTQFPSEGPHNRICAECKRGAL